MKFLTSSMRRQLLGAFTAITALSLVALVIGYSGIGSVRDQVLSAAQQEASLQQAIGNARDMVASQAATVLDPRNASTHSGDVAAFEQNLATIRSYAATPAARTSLGALDGVFAQWQATDGQIVALARAHRAAQATALVTGRGNALADQLTQNVDKLSAAISGANSAAAASSASRSRTLMLLLAVVAIVSAGAISVLISRDVARRTNCLLEAVISLDSGSLAALGDGLDAIARGDLTVNLESHTEPLEVTRNDELGKLTSTFNAMVEKAHSSVGAYNITREKVARMLRAIGRTSEHIASASQQMASTSDEAGRAVGEIAQAVSSVAEGAEDQVRSIAEARTLSDEVAAVTQASADRAQHAAQAATQTRTLADEGAQAISHATAAMDAVRASSAEASSAIRSLDAKSEQIGAIVDTITGIAEQTHLLALNAAIEAARVGEQGRGFAVVADEVRKLAEESRSAAASIAKLIQDIQHATRHVVDVVEQGSQQTADGVVTVEQARDAFNRISNAVEDVSGRVQEIASQVELIASAGTRMQDSMTSVAAVAEQSSASTEQVSASTQQTSASAQQIAASAGELARTAEELERLVGQFTLA
jgi:methyl-accepting chemotaxis protein